MQQEPICDDCLMALRENRVAGPEPDSPSRHQDCPEFRPGSFAPREAKNRSSALAQKCFQGVSFPVAVGCQSFAFSRASFSAINARISSDMFRSFNHCSLYKVTGKRPIP
jgi:hypothetical protein